MANRTSQVSECLHKLYDLMPDGIITYEVSDFRSIDSSILPTKVGG
jgi:hypothetical protein